MTELIHSGNDNVR